MSVCVFFFLFSFVHGDKTIKVKVTDNFTQASLSKLVFMLLEINSI